MFGLTGRNIPRLHSYDQVRKHWDNAPDQNDGWRGLHNKRDTSKRIKLWPNDDGAITLRYHHTDMITWYPDRIDCEVYPSASSVVFASPMLPPGISAQMVRGQMYYTQNGKYYQPVRGCVTFVLVNDRWMVDESTVKVQTQFVLDRKRAGEIRKLFKPWTRWNDALTRLGASYAKAWPTANDRVLFKKALSEGVVPESMYRELASTCASKSPRLMPALYLLGGAVSTKDLPLGTPGKRSPYDSIDRVW